MISIHSSNSNHPHRGPMDGTSVGKVPEKPSPVSSPSFCNSSFGAKPHGAAPTSVEAQRAMSITGRPYLSWSQVASYTLCPKAFEFKYVQRIEPDFIPVSLAFGIAFHDAVASVAMADLEGAPRPSVADLMPHIVESMQGATTPLRLGKGESLESLHALANRMLTAYLESPASKMSGSAICIEDCTRGTIDVALPPIEARVDSVYQSESGTLVVRDVKTTRTKWSAEKVAEAAPQLQLYALLVNAELESVGSVKHLEFLTVTKASKPVVALHQVPVLQTPQTLVAQLKSVWQGMTLGVYPARPGWPCKTCPYASKCPAAIKPAGASE